MMHGLLAWDGGLTLAAPMVAILLAVATRRVELSLGAGVLVAALVAQQGRWLPGGGEVAGCVGVGCEQPGAISAAVGFLTGALFDVSNLTISSFTMLVGAMIGVMGSSGATEALVVGIERRARGRRGAMVASWLAGLVVFFDDYANCLVVGQAMGPVCDRNGVSRAKLAYIVDSTAAPVASLALVGTWVGYEVGLIDAALAELGRGGQGFQVFVSALPYRFYSLFALALVGMLAVTGLDYGPMWAEEVAARKEARERVKVPRAAAAERRLPPVHLAALPVITLLVVTFAVMLWQGVLALKVPLAEAPLHALLAGANTYYAMFAGSLYAFLIATYVGIRAGTLDGEQWAEGTAAGVRAVLGGLSVLYLAWALGDAIAATGAADFLKEALVGVVSPAQVPALTFLLAGIIGFATGTSFGTMSILLPLAVPLAVQVAPDDPSLLAATTAAVLGGACFGDHASPISDTTVLSAAGAQVDLITHVQTQMPYALTAGAVALCLGYLPVGLGLSVWLALPAGLATLFGIVRLLGRDPDEAVAEPAPPAPSVRSHEAAHARLQRGMGADRGAGEQGE